MGFLVTNFGADAGCTDDGKQWVSFWPHCHINTWKDLWEFVLVLICWSNRVYKHLQTSKIKECWNKILKHFSCFKCTEMDRSIFKQLTMPILTEWTIHSSTFKTKKFFSNVISILICFDTFIKFDQSIYADIIKKSYKWCLKHITWWH